MSTCPSGCACLPSQVCEAMCSYPEACSQCGSCGLPGYVCCCRGMSTCPPTPTPSPSPSPPPGSYAARFTDVNDTFQRYLVVCVDKTWGQPGCGTQPGWYTTWTGDWVTLAPGQPGNQVTSPYFTPSTVLTAITSSSDGYYYKVDIIDNNGNVVKTCNDVNRNNPCYYYVSAPPTSSPTPSPTSQPTPTPTPYPTSTPTPSPGAPAPPSAPPSSSMPWTDIAIILAVLAASGIAGYGIAQAIKQKQWAAPP